MIRMVTRQIEKLHSEDGQALVFVAMVGLVIFLFFAMTMNVADLVNTKIKNQNVADATALSAAVWQARALNLISAANRNMLELWAVAIATLGTCGPGLVACDLYGCGENWIDPIWCISCLALFGAECAVGLSFLAGAHATGQFQELVLDVFDKDFVEQDVADVVDLNYSFKENTRRDAVGMYLLFGSQGEDLLSSYVPSYSDPGGQYVLERVGFCETAVMVFRYLFYISDTYSLGLTDEDWQTLAPLIAEWYNPGGLCFQKLSIPPLVPELGMATFPLALRTRDSNWNPQSLDALLAINVATWKAQEPPPALGKGIDSGDCAWEADETRFACPNARHYAFASAHAFSESSSDFYNVQMAGTPTPYPIPYVPFLMDWRPRLFPFEPYPGGVESVQSGGYDAYQEIADRVADDGLAQDAQSLLDNADDFRMGGMHFFLY